MSSQDTMSYAQSEEEKAKIVQHEIEKEQADISELQKDINSKTAVMSGLQQKYEQHVKDGQRLRQQAIEEQQHEQQEQLREQEKDKDGLIKKGVKEAAQSGFFG